MSTIGLLVKAAPTQRINNLRMQMFTPNAKIGSVLLYQSTFRSVFISTFPCGSALCCSKRVIL